ncbi:hypothetical protein E2P84_31180 [Burkholderia cepacia]|uniref:Uncharacterized protein n=1 Tax=Burkholderia cepacia TaxID=292 RepID=A0AAX2REX0_BURCE|nr:hypothetical protein [Burkholderia cepacia]TES70152.1 hypothetical protein E2P84_31180 [Burkholderia cepacia]TES97453.1 hypothetical protein E3D36_32400 [Burkholderia cepacia]TEU35282.1 hypothetical protein E3D37_37740 [Burkholderia cepacia]TEU40410.1 hypothetical protein E3D38_34595 [Burkholderia cepacia]TEU86551.1 hypothetical protein E3D40_40440 [Burkholderia cepacia]
MKPTKSILSERTTTNFAGPRASGKIRCGTKVLTAAAKQNETAVKIYKDGLAQQRRASAIEKEITAATGLKNPMYPVNTQAFHLSIDDFVMPILPKVILDLYGETVNGARELRMFPVFFHSNELFDFFPHRFESNSGKDRYRSAFNDKGDRVCEVLPDLDPKKVAEQRRAGVKRLPPRDWTVRSLCDPRTCQQFQAGQCQFRGTLKFYIPGVVGLGVVAMETSSEYAAENIWSTLDQIRNTLGHIPNFNPKDPDKPVFYITKVQEERAYFDGEGKRKVGLQWVPRLVPAIDIASMLHQGRNLAQQIAPVAWLSQAPINHGAPEAATGRSAEVIDDDGATVSTDRISQLQSTLEEIFRTGGCSRELALRYLDHKYGFGWDKSVDLLGKAVEGITALTRYKENADVYLESRLLTVDYRIPQELFDVYAKHILGNWERSFPKMRDLIAHITQLFANSERQGILAMEAACAAMTQGAHC